MIRNLLLLTLSFFLGLGLAQDKELTLWSVSAEPEIYEELLADFSAQQGDVTGVFEGRAVDAHKEIMRQVINTSSVPDIYFMWGGLGLGGFYVESNGVEPLDSYYEELGWAEQFPQAALEAATFDDQLYGVPFRIRTMGLFYSKAAFEEAGIESEPTTYEELIEVNRKLKEAGITPLSIGGKFGWNTMRLVDSLMEWACGAETHDALKALEADWSAEPCVVQAYEELKRWTDEGWLPDNFLGIDPGNSHIPAYTGEAAMLYEGDWMVGRFEEEGSSTDDFGFFPFPTNTERISFFTELFFVPNTAADKEEAIEFLDFMVSAETQQEYAGRFGTLSPTLGVELPGDIHALAQETNEIVADAPGIYVPGDQALPLEVVNEYFRAQDDVIAGVASPQEAAEIMQQAANAFKQ